MKRPKVTREWRMHQCIKCDKTLPSGRQCYCYTCKPKGSLPSDAMTSWILREITTKRVICETFDPCEVKALNTAKYEAVPILEYLQSINGKQTTDERKDEQPCN